MHAYHFLFFISLESTLMTTNADMKISLYFHIYLTAMLRKFLIPTPKNIELFTRTIFIFLPNSLFKTFFLLFLYVFKQKFFLQKMFISQNQKVTTT